MEKDEHLQNQVLFITNSAYDALESDVVTNEAESIDKLKAQDDKIE